MQLELHFTFEWRLSEQDPSFPIAFCRGKHQGEGSYKLHKQKQKKTATHLCHLCRALLPYFHAKTPSHQTASPQDPREGSAFQAICRKTASGGTSKQRKKGEHRSGKGQAVHLSHRNQEQEDWNPPCEPTIAIFVYLCTVFLRVSCIGIDKEERRAPVAGRTSVQHLSTPVKGRGDQPSGRLPRRGKEIQTQQASTRTVQDEDPVSKHTVWREVAGACIRGISDQEPSSASTPRAASFVVGQLASSTRSLIEAEGRDRTDESSGVRKIHQGRKVSLLCSCLLRRQPSSSFFTPSLSLSLRVFPSIISGSRAFPAALALYARLA